MLGGKMATTITEFRAEKPTDRAFFALFIALCWTGVLMGFFPASGARMMGKADYDAPLILHIHAFAFVGWLTLLTIQILLIRKDRRDVHMKLGIAGLVLVPIMAYSGLAAELYSQRFYIKRDAEGLDFFILPLFYTVMFPAFALTALAFARRDSSTHKRLILMSTTLIVGAAYARWWGAALERMFGDGYWGMILNSFMGTNLILALAVGYDVATRRRAHRAYWIALPIIIAGELLTSWIYHAPWWPELSRALIEVRLPLSA